MDTAETIIIIALLGAGAYLLYKKYRPVQKTTEITQPPIKITTPTETTTPVETTPLPISTTVKPTIQYGELEPVGQSSTLTQSQIEQEIQNSIPIPQPDIPRSVSQIHAYTPQIKIGVNFNDVPWLKKTIEYAVPPLHDVKPKYMPSPTKEPVVVSPPKESVIQHKEPVIVSPPREHIVVSPPREHIVVSPPKRFDPYECIVFGQRTTDTWGKPFINFDFADGKWYGMYFDFQGTGHLSPGFDNPHDAYNWVINNHMVYINRVIVLTPHGYYYVKGFRC